MFYLIVAIISYFIIVFIHRYLVRILDKKMGVNFNVLEETKENFSEKDKTEDSNSDKESPKNNPNYASDDEEADLIQLSQDELNDELDNYMENIDEGSIKESNAFNVEYSLEEKEIKPLDSFYKIANKEKYEIQDSNWVPSNENVLNGGEIFNGIQGYSDDTMFSNFEN